jgi:hypothetical protein
VFLKDVIVLLVYVCDAWLGNFRRRTQKFEANFTCRGSIVLGWTLAAVKSQAFFFTVGALIGIFVSTLSPGKPNSEDSKLSRPFMGRQASWLSELSTSTTAGGKRD